MNDPYSYHSDYRMSYRLYTFRFGKILVNILNYEFIFLFQIDVNPLQSEKLRNQL